MDENPTHSQGATGVKAPDQDTSENHYELDLEEHAPMDIDEAFKDAVAAVDRSKEESADESSGVEAADSEVAESEAPDAARPDAAQPDAAQPDAAQPDAAQPDAAQPDAARLESEATSLRERLMRTLADFDNYRKRTEREKQTLRRFANFDVFKDFLGVLDNFERAMESAGSTEDLKQGLKMIVRQQEEILRRHGVEVVDAVGKPFDPAVHEAVAREENVEVDVPTVVKELQRGYLLHDRLLRPAMVFVAMPGAEDGEAGDTAEGEAGEASD